MASLKIGELAERSGCLVETVRYYERIGLLPAPLRTGNNYRAYTEEHADRLLFIRHCRALDMSIDEIRALVGIRSQPDSPCLGVNQLLDRHIRRVKQRLQALHALEAQLVDLRACCGSARASSDCGILHALADAAAPEQPSCPAR